MRIAELVTAIIIGFFSVYLMWKSGQGPSWDPTVERFANIGINIDGEGPGSGFWPFWLSLIMLLCSFWVIFNWVKRTSPPSQSEEVFLDGYGKRMVVLVGGGLIFFLLMIVGLSFFGIMRDVEPGEGPLGFLTGVARNGIGFYGAIFFFLIYYLLFLGRHSLKLTMTIAVLVPTFCFFFFDIAMRIVLPKGHLEPLFIPLYDMFL